VKAKRNIAILKVMNTGEANFIFSFFRVVFLSISRLVSCLSFFFVSSFTTSNKLGYMDLVLLFNFTQDSIDVVVLFVSRSVTTQKLINRAKSESWLYCS